MANLELSKSIEAKKLNKRTRLPLPEPPVIIPFGGLVSDLEPDGDLMRFIYLGEMYQCKADLLNSALGGHAAAEAAYASGSRTTAPATGGAAAAPAKTPAPFQWQSIQSNMGAVLRAKVPGGWMIAYGSGVMFYADPEHSWDGKTLE
jgi:hypothetical protein